MDAGVIKALHIIFITTWFAGLFYIVRLFIYHVEAYEKDEAERNILIKQYKVMEGRLWKIITWPSAVLTLILGTTLMIQGGWLSYGFMHLKLGFVALLYIYHFICHWMFNRLQRDELKWSSTQLRMWNEVATVLLFAIVFIIVLKNTVTWIYGLAWLIGLSFLLMMAVKWYKRIRER